MFPAVIMEEPPTVRCSEIFADWFSRYLGLLHFTASRVLGDSEEVELAVWNCWLAASRNPQRFEHEGEHRSWLIRLLIDSALEIRHR